MKKEEPLGPSPVRSRAGGARLSGQRAAVLERLQQRDAAVTIADLAAELGVHSNTVREHLDALVEHGLATRTQVRGVGRGRPAWQYAAAPDNLEPDLRVRDYAGLAGALAGYLTRTSPDPAAEARAAGQEWGRELASGDSGRRTEHSRSPRHRAMHLLAELGFDPVADDDATTAALRRCPLLDAARRYPDVVCRVHEGIVQGALEEFGGDAEHVRLLAFSEPGACRLHLARVLEGAKVRNGSAAAPRA